MILLNDKRAVLKFSFLILGLIAISAIIIYAGGVFGGDGAIITTDKDDYSPGEIVLISGIGFLPESEITIDVTRPDDEVESGTADSDEEGYFTYDYDLNGIEGEYLVEASDGTNSAQTSFSDCVSITVVAHKIVCKSESDLPNWGTTSGPAITSNTASDYVTAHPNDCHLESGWNFQWAFNEDNPGDNLGCVNNDWNTFGPTNSSGMVSVEISNANSGTLWFRECLKANYIGFSGVGGSDVTAEFYCNGDVFNYDNLDYIKDQIVNGNTYYCVAFNVPICTTDDDCGSCEKCEDNECVFFDEEGPLVSDPFVGPELTKDYADIGAHAEDECSNINHAKYYVDNACQNEEGTLYALDGNYDKKIEDLIKYDADFRLFADGRHDIYIMAWDDEENPSNCAHITLNIDKVAPDNPRCDDCNGEFGMKLNGQCNIPELLVCGNNPLLTAYIRDGESKLQAAEYFIDDFGQPNWEGIPMQATDGAFDEQCEEVQAEVDISKLEDGTHYIKLHGKDKAENWGKLIGFDAISFIKDTTPPTTTKQLNPADGKKVECQISSANGKTITDGCYYVKQGTTIELTAQDYNPGDGEFAGYVVIKYNVWYTTDNECDEGWTIDQAGQSNPDEPIQITLNKDSCHLIEYWAVDLCGNAETKHYELDIVDTQAPVTTKEVRDPKVVCDPQDPNNCDYYITQQTTITLDCTDPQPHPVDDVKIYYRHYLDGQTAPSFTEDSNHVVFTIPQDSKHIVEYYCVDALGNTEATQQEIDIVDTQPPVSTKEISEPKYWDGQKQFVDGITTIELTCVDPESHPVDDVKIYYRYKVDCGEFPAEFTEYTVPFSFPEESKHELEWYCIDALGNKETHQFETDYVDHTPPETTKTYGEPFYKDGTSEWINSETEITLSAVDPDTTGKGCNSGVAETYYRVTLLGSDEACLSDSVCQQQEGTQEWTTYSSPFTIADESCHLIEYYSIDHVDKTETIKKQCVFVDNSAPSGDKEVGEPKVGKGIVLSVSGGGTSKLIDGSAHLYAPLITSYPPSNEGRLHIPLDITLNDINTLSWDADVISGYLPHVDIILGNGESLTFEYAKVDPADCDDVSDYPTGEVNTFGDKGIVDDSAYAWESIPGPCGDATFDAQHKSLAEWKTMYGTEDVLALEIEVDGWIYESESYVNNIKLNGEDVPIITYVKTSTEITLSCVDPLPHPVNNEKLCFKISWDDDELIWKTDQYCSFFEGKYNSCEEVCCVDVNNEDEFTFHFLEESLHNIEWYCEDALGNEEQHSNIEWDNVDDTAPAIFVWNPTPSEASNIERCMQSIVVQVFDEKSGVDEDSVYAQLLTTNGESPNEKVREVQLTKSLYGTYEGLMDKELPAEDYILRIIAKDNLGNERIYDIKEELKETVFVEYIDPALCTIDPTTGGECDFTFHICMRGDNSIRFWINKLAGIITPDMMNAMISDNGNDAIVGLRHENGFSQGECIKEFMYWDEEKCYYSSYAEILQLADDCVEINGKEQFTLHLDVPADVASQLGMGKHDLEYWIESSLQEDCNNNHAD